MTTLGNVLTEVIRWNPKTWRVDGYQPGPELNKSDAGATGSIQEFRARVKSAPQILNGGGEYFLRNVWEQGIRLENKLELVKKRNSVVRNTDLPDTLPLDEMGVPGPSNREDFVWPAVDPNAPPYRKSTHLDSDKQEILLNGDRRLAFTRTVGGMNDRDFRERCVQANGKLYVLYPMGLPEVSPPNHLRAETVSRWLAGPCRCKRECAHQQTEVPEYDADSLVKVLSKLQMDRASTTRMMFGYMGFDGAWRNGIKSLDAEGIADLAYYLEDLEAQLPQLTPEGENAPVQLDDYRAYYLDVSQKLVEMGVSSTGDGLPYDLKTWKGQMNYIEDMARKSLTEEPNAEPHPAEIDWLIRKGFSVEEDSDTESENQAYEDSDFKSVGDGWTAFPLHYGEDTVDWNWISCIRTAGIKRLQAWKRAMGKLWYLTYQQRSDLWNRIWERQEQLVAKIDKKVDRTVKDIVDEMRGLNERQAKALIYSYQVGGSFNAFNMFDFDEPGDPELVFWLWDYYRKTYK